MRVKGTDLPVVMQLTTVQFWMSGEEVKIRFAALRSIKKEGLFWDKTLGLGVGSCLSYLVLLHAKQTTLDLCIQHPHVPVCLSDCHSLPFQKHFQSSHQSCFLALWVLTISWADICKAACVVMPSYCYQASCCSCSSQSSKAPKLGLWTATWKYLPCKCVQLLKCAQSTSGACHSLHWKD